MCPHKEYLIFLNGREVLTWVLLIKSVVLVANLNNWVIKIYINGTASVHTIGPTANILYPQILYIRPTYKDSSPRQSTMARSEISYSNESCSHIVGRAHSVIGPQVGSCGFVLSRVINYRVQRGTEGLTAHTQG